MPDAPLRQLLLREFGAVVGGRDLRNVLGFRSAAAFQRAVRSGHLRLRFFSVPGRKGRFALILDIADWLESTAEAGAGAFEFGHQSVKPTREGAQM
jgi:hypothetical protein